MTYKEYGELLDKITTFEEQIDLNKRYYNCPHDEKKDTDSKVYFKTPENSLIAKDVYGISCRECINVKFEEGMNEELF